MSLNEDIRKVRTLVEDWLVKLDAQRVSLTLKIETLANLHPTTENQIKIDALTKSLQKLEDKIFGLELDLAKLPLPRPSEAIGHQSWSELIEDLSKDENRARVGREIELMRLSVQRVRERWSELHEFGDGTLDQPLFSSETVKDEH